MQFRQCSTYIIEIIHLRINAETQFELNDKTIILRIKDKINDMGHFKPSSPIIGPLIFAFF